MQKTDATITPYASLTAGVASCIVALRARH